MGHVWPRRHSRLGHHPRHRIHLSVHRSSAAGWRNGRHSQRQPWRFEVAAWNVQSAVPHGLLFWSRWHQFARPIESLRGWSSCKSAADEIAQRGCGRPYFLADQPARRRVWARHQFTGFRTRQFWALHRESAIGWSVMECGPSSFGIHRIRALSCWHIFG